MDKWVCLECRHVGPIAEFDFIADPRPGHEGSGWYACRHCDGIDDKVTTACDEPGCIKEGTCGFPVNDERKYRRTCFEHATFFNKGGTNEQRT